MKSFVFALLFVFVMSVSVTAQTEVARKVGDLGSTSDGDVKKSVQDIRDAELNENPGSKLYIINYGISNTLRGRLIQLEKAFIFLGLERKTIEISTSITNPFLLTEFWIVPEKAENPKPSEYAEKFSEIGLATDGKVKIRIQQFFERIEKTPNSIAYFLNYGSAKQKTLRIKQINKSINFLMHDSFRLIVVDGGYSKTVKTELWISNPRENNK
jgi:hypothetical protein